MSFSVKGKTALVTGANRGIGAAIVDALIAAGASKVYAAARQLSDLAELSRRHGSKIVALELDVTNAEQVRAAVSRATDLQMLVNNAGVAAHAGGAFTDPQWLVAGRQEMEVNYFGTFQLSQAFAPVLAANGGGAIVNIGSVASLVNFPLFVAYSASKAATHSITQAARILLKAQGTQVFGVYPGPIDTRMAAEVPFDKTSPADAARAIVTAIEAGIEEIFPDPMSQSMGSAYLSSPKALEQQVAAMVAG
ncbi:SDR family oxidoreductase [Permianibacter sp. IMCC34836]|uniref:SDR family oxidoreductase n=1 Tax=Permianibacter fluminis TaxID=2738515 RepID=UPI00155382B4|nr:SDR family oxidoreductase [Permianibacter fluminis]NQD36610.1 SDR family oxidoreductase [Permianibacter fluminis]